MEFFKTHKMFNISRLIFIIGVISILFKKDLYGLEVKSYSDTTSIGYYLGLLENQIGEMAPDWELADIDGNKYHLSEYKGKFVLLEFWAVGCGACIKSVKAINRLDSLYKDKGLIVIGIESAQKANEVQTIKFINDYDFKYLTLFEGKVVAENYKVRAFPSVFLINKMGKIVYANIGSIYFDKSGNLIETDFGSMNENLHELIKKGLENEEVF